MAKRASKAKPVKVVLDPDGNPPSNEVPSNGTRLNERVAKLISRGEMAHAAAEVKGAELSDAERNAILDGHPNLRDVCNRL